ncbi:MAG: ImmA/IrrE family metallo-endopeptidase [Candidatus Thiodiazotropha endolucinida]
MDEFSVILKARQFIKDAGITSVPVDIDKYASAANAKIKISFDLEDDESGQTFPLAGKHIITINGNHLEERQRFTALHEIAHIVLELPSQHHGTNVTTSDLVSYRRRPKEEIMCDVFAAECLLPHDQFRADVEELDVSMDEVVELANRYKASITSTGSRYAVNCNVPCAFVLIDNGKVRYVSMSKFLRERKGWIELGVPIPIGSVAHRLSNDISLPQDCDEIPVDVWFTNGITGFDLLAEESIALRDWDQYLSLIWFDEDLRSVDQRREYYEADGEPLLEELDGILPWPSKSRRK